jgi:hypothetical protein
MTENTRSSQGAADALFLASDAFLNVEQLFRILRGETEGKDTTDRERVAALIQIGIDITHMQGELVRKEADAAYREANHG